jgi:16S rRNA (cytidine1402-2'-O)-methyltransferase
MAEAVGDRPAAVAFELTKRFERVERGTLSELAAHFSEGDTKGEAVILVGGAEGTVVEEADWKSALEEAMVEQPLRAAVDEITALYGLKRKEVYDAALALKAEE